MAKLVIRTNIEVFFISVVLRAMILFPNSKINLGLHVISKRSDGFHSIETVFYPVQWRDVLEITPHLSAKKKIKITFSGIPIDGNSNDNLCVKAYQLLDTEYSLPPVQMHLHKIIPMGAGLGGGSADAAFTLKILNNIFGLNLKEENLLNYASHLGSDCAFFIKNKAQYAQGKGDVLSDIYIPLKGYWILVVKPQINISTQEAYSGIFPKQPKLHLIEVLKQMPEYWKDFLINDFEEGIFKKYPIIKSLKENLYERGAVYASMSGSGSAVYGIFKSEPDVSDLNEYTFWKELF